MDTSASYCRVHLNERGNDEWERQNDLYHSAVAELGPSIARVAMAYEANPTQQQDLLQEIHIALWRSLAAFNGDCSLRTWVYRVAHNTANSHVLRDKRRRPSKLISLDQLEELPEETDDVRLVDEQAVLQKLKQLIGQLRQIDSEVLVLYLDGLEATEIAEIVGISPSNVAQKIHRTKKILTKQFQARSQL